jgi:hypothetical protein
MYIPEALCNLVSEGKFRNKGLYLDAQKDIIHDGNKVVANCPILICVNIRILETHPDHDTIDRKVRYSLVATKIISLSLLGGRLVVSGVIYWSRCIEGSIVVYIVCVYC